MKTRSIVLAFLVIFASAPSSLLGSGKKSQKSKSSSSQRSSSPDDFSVSFEIEDSLNPCEGVMSAAAYITISMVNQRTIDSRKSVHISSIGSNTMVKLKKMVEENIVFVGSALTVSQALWQRMYTKFRIDLWADNDLKAVASTLVDMVIRTGQDDPSRIDVLGRKANSSYVSDGAKLASVLDSYDEAILTLVELHSGVILKDGRRIELGTLSTSDIASLANQVADRFESSNDDVSEAAEIALRLLYFAVNRESTEVRLTLGERWRNIWPKALLAMGQSKLWNSISESQRSLIRDECIAAWVASIPEQGDLASLEYFMKQQVLNDTSILYNYKLGLFLFVEALSPSGWKTFLPSEYKTSTLRIRKGTVAISSSEIEFLESFFGILDRYRMHKNLVGENALSTVHDRITQNLPLVAWIRSFVVRSHKTDSLTMEEKAKASALKGRALISLGLVLDPDMAKYAQAILAEDPNASLEFAMSMSGRYDTDGTPRYKGPLLDSVLVTGLRAIAHVGQRTPSDHMSSDRWIKLLADRFANNKTGFESETLAVISEAIAVGAFSAVALVAEYMHLQIDELLDPAIVYDPTNLGEGDASVSRIQDLIFSLATKSEAFDTWILYRLRSLMKSSSDWDVYFGLLDLWKHRQLKNPRLRAYVEEAKRICELHPSIDAAFCRAKAEVPVAPLASLKTVPTYMPVQPSTNLSVYHHRPSRTKVHTKNEESMPPQAEIRLSNVRFNPHALATLKTFPPEARRQLGHQLHLAQAHDSLLEATRVIRCGAHCWELKAVHLGIQYRLLYEDGREAGVINVLNVFIKDAGISGQNVEIDKANVRLRALAQSAEG